MNDYNKHGKRHGFWEENHNRYLFSGHYLDGRYQGLWNYFDKDTYLSIQYYYKNDHIKWIVDKNHKYFFEDKVGTFDQHVHNEELYGVI